MRFEGRRVFVTGGTGFIGGVVVRKLRAEGAEVTCLVRRDTDARDVERLGARVVRGNVTEPATLDLAGHDLLVHAAAWVGFGLPEAKRRILRATNVGGTQNVLHAAERAGVKKVVHVSSIAAIGAPPAGLITEETPRPSFFKSDYERTKTESHALALASKIPAALPMPGLVVGMNGPFDRIFRALAHGRVPALPGDDAIKGWVHVEDAAEGILLCALKGAGPYLLVDENAIEVYRPVSASRSTGSATGNPHFYGLSIAPAIWADGSDRVQFSIVVRDSDGSPMAGVPLRVTSLRPDLTVQGTNLGGTVTISLDGTTTDASGRLTGELTTRTSSRAYKVPQLGVFQSFALMVEADAGHGVWRRLADIGGLNAETVVNGNEQIGEFNVQPSGLTCVGQQVQIHARAVRRPDAPGAGGPAGGLVGEIRFAASGDPLPGLRPAPGYENWRTDATGRIVFLFTPTQPDFRTIRAWIDGQPINITAALAAQSC